MFKNYLLTAWRNIKKNKGFLDQKFYLVDENGNKPKFPYLGGRILTANNAIGTAFTQLPLKNLPKIQLALFGHTGPKPILFQKVLLHIES